VGERVVARIRSLKPETFQSETLANVSLEAERTFLGLSTQADDRGRFRWQPKTLNGVLWSERGNHQVAKFELELAELISEHALCRYVGCDGKIYGHLVRWDSHQKVDKPSPSRIPPCLEHQPQDGDKNRCPQHGFECSGSSQVTATLESSPNPPRALATDLGSRIVDPGSRIVDPGSTTPPPSAPREDIDGLCKHLADRIEKHGAKRPTTGKTTREAARLLLDVDKRPLEQAHRLIAWCQDDTWWHSRVLSMPKFRDKYDQLLLQAKSRGQPSTGFTPFQNPADQSVYDQPLEAS
jgi:hypothetical protein